LCAFCCSIAAILIGTLIAALVLNFAISHPTTISKRYPLFQRYWMLPLCPTNSSSKKFTAAQKRMNYFLYYRFHFFMQIEAMKFFLFILLHSHQTGSHTRSLHFCCILQVRNAYRHLHALFQYFFLNNGHHLSKPISSSEERRIFWKIHSLEGDVADWKSPMPFIFRRLIVHISRHLSVATVSQSSIRIVCVSHELIKSRTVDDGF
jgi:hypothetical protein